MKLRTEIAFKESAVKYGYNNHFLLMGSCFSDEIGQKLIDNKFNVIVNPFGTIFNPISLFDKIENCASEFDQNHFLETKDLWFHYDYHSKFYGKTKGQLIESLQMAKAKLKSGLQTCDLLILTLGTAFVHQLDDRIINNCHKQPSSNFVKRLLSIDEIVNSFKSMYRSLDCKPQVLLTVSPVRHTREGIAENQLSKSILRVACNEIVTNCTNVHYFPSYETVVDDLRDYRFYKEDLIHPSDQTVDYIFKKFISNYFSDDALKTLEQIKKINLELRHRSQDITSKQHQKFLNQLIVKMEKQTVDYSTEIETIKTQLI